MRGSNKMDIHVYVLIVCNYFNWISGRTWQTVYMDDSTHCSLNRIKNDNMAESDYYRVMSDSWNGKSRWAQRPAECWLAFNFGDRYVTVTLDEWRCRAEFQKPFLSIYDDCHGKRKNLLAQLNCSVQVPMTVRSSGPCISLYHYRGHTKWGYFFSLHVAARQEIIAFPAGGIAGLIIGIIVFIMIIVKIVCVVSGFEDRLPMLNLQPNEQKQIMANALSSVTKISESNSTGDTRIKETIVMNVPNEQTILRVTRSSMCSENNDAVDVSKVDVDMYDVTSTDHVTTSTNLNSRRSTTPSTTSHAHNKQCPLLSTEEYTAFNTSGTARCASVSGSDRLLMPRASMGALQQGSVHGMSRVGRYASARANSIFGKR